MTLLTLGHHGDLFRTDRNDHNAGPGKVISSPHNTLPRQEWDSSSDGRSDEMAKTRSRQKRIGIRDRLGRLTFQGACRLLGDDGEAKLRRSGHFEINLPRDVYLGGG